MRYEHECVQAYYQDDLPIAVDDIEENSYSFAAISSVFEKSTDWGIGYGYAETDTYYVVSLKSDIDRSTDDFYRSMHTVASSGNNVTMVGGQTETYNGISVDNYNVLYNSGGSSVLMFGGNSEDSLLSTGRLGYIDAMEGDDYIYSGDQENSLFGGVGNDTILNYGAYNVISGGEGNDSIANASTGEYSSTEGGLGDDVIILSTSSAHNLIRYALGDGNDVVMGFNSDDILDITNGVYKKSNDGNDLVITVGNGSIRFPGLAGGAINILGTPAEDYGSSFQGNVTAVVNPEEKRADEAARENVQYTINNYYNTIINEITNTENTNINNVTNNNTTNINNTNIVVINKTDNHYTYNGGNSVINNYTEGEVVQLTGEYRGIDLQGNSFIVKLSGGDLEIQNCRDKFIGYSAGDNNVVAYSYLASGGGTIDGRGKNQAEIMIGADNSDNQILAGSGGSSLWGGNGGNDTLSGGEGYDEFFFAMGSGNDVVQNASSNDMINLLGVSLSQISGFSYDNSSVTLNFNDGGSLRVEGNTGIGYRLENQTHACNQATGEWYTR